MKDKKFLVGGTWHASTEQLEIKDKYSGEPVANVFRATDAQAEDAIKWAVRAFRETRKLPVYRRVEILSKIVQGLEKRKDEIAETMTRESGKPISFSRIEADRAVFNFTCAMEEAKRIGGEVIPMELLPDASGRYAITQRFPIGPVFGISPFNFPLNLAVHKVAPALAAGNTMILKPPSLCPLSALIMAEVIEEAGALPGWVNVIPCSVELGEKFAKDDRIQAITFTGSPSTGFHLKAISGKKRVILELGGNAGIIVHSDANQDFAIKRIIRGGFGQAGQSCIAVQRVYVHKDIFEDFSQKLISETQKLKYGDPMDPETVTGPMISEKEAARAESWVKEAIQGGAKVLTGGERDRSLLQPTIIGNVTPEMKVSCVEVFAPIITLESYDTFENAVRRVDNTNYGLQAGVFTSDIGRIWYAFNNLDVGGVVINDYSSFRVDHMPYGGVKDSGMGREGIKYAIQETTEPRLLILNFNQV